MSSDGRVGKWILGCTLFLGLSTAACCGGGALIAWFSPSMLVSLAMTDTPLPIAATPADPERKAMIRARIDHDLSTTGTTRITSDDLDALAASTEDTRTRVTLIGDRATLDFTTRPDPAVARYVNVHVAGRFTLEHGWFTTLKVDEARLSDWELGKYVAGQELAMNANQSLAQQRAKDPQMDGLLAATDRVVIADGAFAVTLTPEGQRTWGATTPTPPTVTPADTPTGTPAGTPAAVTP